MLRINIISTCEIGYKNTLARMESVCTLRLGLSVLINNISYTKQSNLFLHFLSTSKRLLSLSLFSFTISSCSSFLLVNTGWMVLFTFRLKSLSCFFTNSAEFWSLNGKTTRTVLSVPWAVDKGRGWSQTFESEYCNFSIIEHFLTLIME